MATATPQIKPARLPCPLIASLVCVLLSAALQAQEPPPEKQNDPEGPEAAPQPDDARDPAPDPDEGSEPDPQPEPESPPSEALTAAKDAYIADDYEAVVRFLLPVAESGDIESLAEPFQADIYRLLGLAFISLEPPQRDKARAVFKKLLTLQSDFVFTEGLVSPEAIEILDEAREELGDIGGNHGALPGITTIYIQKEVREQNFLLVFMPFGLGQFQNGDDGKGTFFAVFEGLGLAVNVFSFGFIERSLRGSDGLFTPQNKEAAEGFRLAQFLSLGFFAVMYGISVWDAWANFEGTSVEIRKLDGPPDELTRGREDPILGRRRTLSSAFDAELRHTEGRGSQWVPSAPLSAQGHPSGGSLPRPITVIQMQWRF